MEPWSHGAPSGPNGQNLQMQSFNALSIENQLLEQALSEKKTADQESLLWAGTVSKLETKFKGLSYEMGLRKSVQ